MELHVERRTVLNTTDPYSLYEVRTSAGDRQFRVAETRHIVVPATVELETRDDGSVPMIRGYASVFDRESHDLGGFTETVARGAFRRALDDPARSSDCRCLFNHDPNMVLASMTNHTLDLREDPQGLHYFAQPADTSYSSDVRELIRRGDVHQSSFAFTVQRDRWEERDDGTILRTVLEIGSLFDVSPVTYPAYPQTTAAARGRGDEITKILEEQNAAREKLLDVSRSQLEALSTAFSGLIGGKLDESNPVEEERMASGDTEKDTSDGSHMAAHRELVARSRADLAAAIRQSLGNY